LLFCVQAAHWFHPAVWLACRRLATLREVACDQQVMSVLQGRAPGYRHTLLKSARLALAGQRPVGLALIGQPCELLIRLAWLERPAAGHTWRHITATLLASGVALVSTLPSRGQANDSRRHEPAPRSTEIAATSSGIAASTTWQPDPSTSTALADQPGCLPLRYFVLARLAEQENAIQP
jgi:hypothetical protein